jgi:NAD(P)-dependent dehydrogenase (short-subunit alcohol dehydrogenase family)
MWGGPEPAQRVGVGANTTGACDTRWYEDVGQISMKRLSGQRAIVTGASRGIGKAIALGYAREGADVVITYASDEASARQVVRAIEDHGSKARAVRFDLLIPQDADSLLQQAVEFMGGVDILVNNAVVKDVELERPLVELSESALVKGIHGFLIGPMRVTQKICGQMIGQRSRGCIINILSVAYKVPLGNTMSQHYEASKAGLAMFTRSLAVGLGQYNIRANAIAPGKTDTAVPGPAEKGDYGRTDCVDAARMGVSRSRVGLGRRGRPEDYQEMAITMVLSEYMTGECITIDGGMSRGCLSLPPRG